MSARQRRVSRTSARQCHISHTSARLCQISSEVGRHCCRDAHCGTPAARTLKYDSVVLDSVAHLVSSPAPLSVISIISASSSTDRTPLAQSARRRGSHENYHRLHGGAASHSKADESCRLSGNGLPGITGGQSFLHHNRLRVPRSVRFSTRYPIHRTISMMCSGLLASLITRFSHLYLHSWTSNFGQCLHAGESSALNIEMQSLAQFTNLAVNHSCGGQAKGTP
jgi:hypothetical protein